MEPEDRPRLSGLGGHFSGCFAFSVVLNGLCVKRCAVLFEFLDVYWEPGKAAKPAKKFDLATSFPKRVFDRQDAEESSTTLADEGIDPQRVFFVQWK